MMNSLPIFICAGISFATGLVRKPFWPATLAATLATSTIWIEGGHAVGGRRAISPVRLTAVWIEALLRGVTSSVELAAVAQGVEPTKISRDFSLRWNDMRGGIQKVLWDGPVDESAHGTAGHYALFEAHLRGPGIKLF